MPFVSGPGVPERLHMSVKTREHLREKLGGEQAHLGEGMPVEFMGLPVKIYQDVPYGEVWVAYSQGFTAITNLKSMWAAAANQVQEVEVRQLMERTVEFGHTPQVKWAYARYEREFPGSRLFGIYLRRGPSLAMHFAEHDRDINDNQTCKDGVKREAVAYAIALAEKHGVKAFLHSPGRGKTRLEKSRG